uniref:Uncharacterized protein n=1 Tax=Strombidium inclinatum TaxID=197538 RepID=A0A7S3MYH2_9SPIT|mmetsp:Transcript_36928/g.56552  ORF Transcript_36928/g.56552 Transcript_36928/m.56552 type:complete len:117 (+) Transcript_36928:231-581(+)
MGTTFSFDFDVYNQTAYFSVKEWDIDDEVEKDDDAVIDTIGVTPDDYEEFWNSLQFMMTFIVRYLNRLIFNNGFPIPVDDFFFDSKIFVQSDSILVLIDPYILNEAFMESIMAMII